jgi:5-methylcytosine-specific restriction endonuclease McrA
MAKRQRGAQPWRNWYKLKRWSDLKLQVHIRDRFVCQRTGVLCTGREPEPNSPVANHKVPHRGDPTLFWDPDNIETVSKAYHDSVIQRHEQATLHQRGVWY